MTQEYDAIVVGAGHNGLVAAGYLARAGLKVMVVERRHIVGGTCVTEEVFPGFWGNTGANLGAWLHPKLMVDMKLQKFGLEVVRTNPSLITPFPDGRAFIAWRQRSRTIEEIEKFSKKDVKAYFGLRDYIRWFAGRLKLSFLKPPPTMAQLLSRLRTPEEEDAYNKLMFGSAKEILDERFESEEIKAFLGVVSTVNNFASPSDPGSPYMWLHRSLISDFIEWRNPRVKALRGVIFRPKDGMGGITQAMEKSIKSSGAVVRTNAEVAHFIVKDGKARGVALASGEEISARVVLSNLDPYRTFLTLLDGNHLDSQFRAKVKRLPMEGSVAKVILALDGLPRWDFAENDAESDLFSQSHFRVAPSLGYMERACNEAREGRAAREPILWGVIPSAVNPAMAPPGKHIMCLTTFHFPYNLRSGDWKGEGDAYAKRCIDVLSQYSSNIKDIVIDYKCLTPKDLEERFGVTEGSNIHGPMMPGNIFSSRPLPGWSEYRTPIDNLYMCGSGTFPGGGVSGIPGHNAAHKVLKDIKEGVIEGAA